MRTYAGGRIWWPSQSCSICASNRTLAVATMRNETAKRNGPDADVVQAPSESHADASASVAAAGHVAGTFFGDEWMLVCFEFDLRCFELPPMMRYRSIGNAQFTVQPSQYLQPALVLSDSIASSSIIKGFCQKWKAKISYVQKWLAFAKVVGTS